MARPSFPSEDPLDGWDFAQIEEAIVRQSLSVTIQREAVRLAANNGSVPHTELDTLAELERELARLKERQQRLMG